MTRARRTRGLSQPLATDDELWGALPPKQARSVDAIQRIAVAGQALFVERDYDDVSVADIAAAAGVSVGAFYTRFPSKEHLIVHLMRDVADELSTRLQREMSTDRMVAHGLADVMRQYLLLMGRSFVRHRALIRPASLIARQTRDAQLRAILRRFNHTAHSHLRGLLLSRLVGLAPDVARIRIDAGILWSSAAMREVLLYGEPVSSLSPRHASLIDELTRGVVLYLAADQR